MKKYLYAAAAVLALAGCATYQHAPDGYTGPTAEISDTSYYETGSKGVLFYVKSIDGNAIQNARNATGSASYGRGFALTAQSETRRVRIEPIKLKLVGTHVTAAPIHEIASRAIGEFFTVEGEVSFLPVAGKKYEVVGNLKKTETSVWIRDAESRERVSEIVIAR
jgi:hypothetical protein